MGLETLRLKVTLPNAHFRVVHSGNPRTTYPVPPYSTVIGFLANILGDMEKIGKMLSGGLALGILAQHEYISREYTWLRNLSLEEHRRRYVTASNRTWQEVAEHPGGQSPATFEVLNEVTVWIYAYHPESAVLEAIRQNSCLPEKWFSHLHLGRSEDWAMLEAVDMVKLEVSNRAADMKETGRYFQWMPEPDSAFGVNKFINGQQYGDLYRKIQGPAMLVTSTYQLVETHLGGGKIGVIRNFKHVPARLTDLPVTFLDSFKLPALFVDPRNSTAVYFARIN